MQYLCVCVCVCVLCALCPVLCAVCCVLWGAVEINKNRILMVFCSFLATKNETTQKQKTRTKKGNKRKEQKKEKKSLGVGGFWFLVCFFVFFFCVRRPFFGGGWCALYITWFFFLTAFPTRCQCRGALLASHAAWRKYLPTFNLVGDAAPHQNEDGQQLRPTAWLAPAAMLLYIDTRWGTVSSLALHPPLAVQSVLWLSFKPCLFHLLLLYLLQSRPCTKVKLKSVSDNFPTFPFEQAKEKTKKQNKKTKQVKNQK